MRRLGRMAAVAVIAVLMVAGLSSVGKGDQFYDALKSINQGDHTAAFQLLRPLAEQGNSGAQMLLGTMCESGKGVDRQDFGEAAKWYRKAADQNHLLAQYFLGRMYVEGRGVLQDLAEAYKWFNIAGSRGYGPAREQRDDIAKKMTSVQIAEAQKLAREWITKHPRK